jgi:hypothetical protein
MFSNKSAALLILVLLFASCKKDEVNFPAEPSITFGGISPAQAAEYSDHVIITLNYEDGDGDLGENTDGVKNCFVTDNRMNVTYQYRIKQLAPSNSSIPIKGNLNVDLGVQAITDNSSNQSVSYSIFVVDRAGHRSNTITSTSIQISK